jgi:hypothetical protein
MKECVEVELDIWNNGFSPQALFEGYSKGQMLW